MNPKDFDIGILERIEHVSYTTFWIFVIIGVITVILAKLNNYSYFTYLFNLSNNFNQKLFSSRSLSAPLLILNYLISLSLIITLAFHSVYHFSNSFSAKSILPIFFSVCIFYFIKTIIQYLLANLFIRNDYFDIKNAFKQYQILGLIFLPLAVFSLYQSLQFQYLTFILAVIILTILYLIQSYSSLKESLQHKISLFYIILYLCTLEILPLFLLAKYLLS